MTTPIFRSALAFLFVAILAGCDSTDGGPDVAGDYHATSFALSDESGQTVDLLERGASLDLAVSRPDGVRGTFRGRIVLPDVDGTGLVDEPISGTYVTTGRVTSTASPDANADAVMNFQSATDVSLPEDAESLFVPEEAAWRLVGDRLSTTYRPGESDGGLVVTLQRG